ncbi:MAG: exodeoxyribonuclease III [Deltaproteobacteria bacterium]|nr:exodeoxyribonuclease III [Deltaproteobacteria bacterium]
MKIATFNANSIRARLPILLDWLRHEDPDILCLQETKVQDQDFPSKPFKQIGYHATFRGQKSYNGVAIISKSPLKESRLDLFEDGDEQARFISGTIDGIPVVNVYVPQGFQVGSDKFQYKLMWLKTLFDHISNRYEPDAPLLVAGDFNVALEDRDVYDPDGFRGGVGFHPEEQALMERFFRWGLVDMFRNHTPDRNHYTFWDYRIPNGFKRNMGWRIDYILGTNSLFEKESSTIWIDTEPRGLEKPSDHTFLIASLML